jgi:transcriptional regulator with XRE-family HTH domain
MDEDLVYKSLGKRIKFIREKKGLTQEKLAERSALSLDYVGKIEVNINKPGLKSLIKIANALDVQIKELFDFNY